MEELKKLKDESFPYLPNVLKMLMLADPRSVPDCERRMDRDFPDALEWLEYKAGNMTAKEWQEFRVRPAEERKEKR